MPGDVRTRFRALAQLEGTRRHGEGLLRTLLRRGGARFTNTVLALSMPPLLLGFALVAILFNDFYVTRHILRGVHALWLLPFALCFRLLGMDPGLRHPGACSISCTTVFLSRNPPHGP